MIAEVSLQIKFVYDARRLLADDWKIIHAPNEEVQNARTVSKQLALGMLPGCPDLIVSEGKPHFLEFKSENGTLDKAQRDFQSWAIRANVPHSVVRSVDEAMRVFEFWVRFQKLPSNMKDKTMQSLQANGFDRYTSDTVGDSLRVKGRE